MWGTELNGHITVLHRLRITELVSEAQGWWARAYSPFGLLLSGPHTLALPQTVRGRTLNSTLYEWGHFVAFAVFEIC